MDKYGFLAETMTPSPDELHKKIDAIHIGLEEVESASDMVAVTLSLLANVVTVIEQEDVSCDEDVLENIRFALDESFEVTVGEDESTRTSLSDYVALLDSRRRGQGFVRGHVDALRVASHLLLEAHRQIFESDDTALAMRSVQVLQGLQRAHSIASQK